MDPDRDGGGSLTRLVVFDVDSTLLEVETLDFALEMAAGPGAGPDLARRLEAVTSAGMEGALDLSESLSRRLSLVTLTRADVDAAAAGIAARATPGIPSLLSDLRARGDHLRAVSGGFLPLVLPALSRLGFGPGHVRANAFRWEGEGAVVAGFEEGSPLARSGGKAAVVRELRAELEPDVTIVVGDGITDLEAWEAGAADRFIGFGGVARREAVAERAPEYAEDVEELRGLLLGRGPGASGPGATYR